MSSDALTWQRLHSFIHPSRQSDDYLSIALLICPRVILIVPNQKGVTKVHREGEALWTTDDPKALLLLFSTALAPPPCVLYQKPKKSEESQWGS